VADRGDLIRVWAGTLELSPARGLDIVQAIRGEIIMSIFSRIRDAVFGHKAQAQPSATPSPTQVGQKPPQAAPAPAAPAPAEPVDVEATLASLAEGKDLNWRTSLVDLMKVLGIDSSLENRKELAHELGYTGELNGSVEMNLWLHKATMRQLAANGGKVPAAMLD